MFSALDINKRLVLITLYSGIFYDLHGDVNFQVAVCVAMVICTYEGSTWVRLLIAD
jgi:hypothetical protein